MPNLRHFLRSASNHQSRASPDLFPVLLDTGCSVSTSGFIDNFCGELAHGNFGQIKSADGQSPIKGFGVLQCQVTDVHGNNVLIRVPGYCVPNVDLRLLSPQDCARFHGTDHATAHSGNAFAMQMKVLRCEESDDLTTIVAPISLDSRLPLFQAQLRTKEESAHPEVPLHCSPKQGEPLPNNHPPDRAPCHCHLVQNLYDERNVNLTAVQKDLKLDHDRLGHISCRRIQHFYRLGKTIKHFDGHTTKGEPCLVPKLERQTRCEPPLCATCQAAKQRRRPTGATHSKPDKLRQDIIRANALKPGDELSLDQCESSVRGRPLPTIRGREQPRKKCVGGTIIFDHASAKIFVRHQVSLSAHESVNAVQAVMREALESGVEFKKFHTDNGVFKTKKFLNMP